MGYGAILGKSTTSWTNDQIMSASTAALFGLGTDAVPDDVLSAIRGPGAITATYPVSSGYSVTAGDIVDVVNGEIITELLANTNKRIIVDTYKVSSICSCLLNENYSIVAASGDGANNKCYLINNLLGTVVSDGGVSFARGHTCARLSIAKLTNSSFIISWSYSYNSYAIIGTVSENSITFGSQLKWAESDFNHILRLSNTTAVGFYAKNTNLYARILTTSGTELSVGTEYHTTSSLGFSAYNDLTLLPSKKMNQQTAIIFFADSQNSYYPTAIAASINSSGEISFGNPVVISTQKSAGSWQTCCTYYDGDVICFWGINAPYYLSSLSTDGLEITVNFSISSSDFAQGNFNSSYSDIIQVGTSCVLLNGYPSNNSKAYNVLINQNKITLSDGFNYDGGQCWYVCAEPISDDKFIVAYGDSLNSGVLTITFLEVRNNQIAGSFSPGSSQAIALQSGNAGDTIEVIYSGTVLADWVTQGQQITSNGVKGVGILDGVLQVAGENSPGTKIVTGSYVGTGKYGISNPNTLEFDTRPKIVFIVSESAGFSSPLVYGYGGYGYYPTVFVGLNVTWGDKSISWYGTQNEYNQLNGSNITYSYLAIL